MTFSQLPVDLPTEPGGSVSVASPQTKLVHLQLISPLTTATLYIGLLIDLTTRDSVVGTSYRHATAVSVPGR